MGCCVVGVRGVYWPTKPLQAAGRVWRMGRADLVLSNVKFLTLCLQWESRVGPPDWVLSACFAPPLWIPRVLAGSWKEVMLMGWECLLNLTSEISMWVSCSTPDSQFCLRL